MVSVGINRETGKVITGWPRTIQSIYTILSTELGDRVQRRDFGSGVPTLIDRPSNVEAVMDLYVAVAEALEPRLMNGRQYGEPCFALTRIQMKFSPTGETNIILDGIEYPNGHRGDFTPAQASRTIQLPVGA